MIFEEIMAIIDGQNQYVAFCYGLVNARDATFVKRGGKMTFNTFPRPCECEMSGKGRS